MEEQFIQVALNLDVVNKIVLFSILVALSFTANSQIDYSAHPESISSANKIVRVDWLRSTPRNCQIDFNHLVNFINTKNDQSFNSKVTVELFHNDELIREFIFPTGDRINNRIYVGEAINLKKGDRVYFVFKLSPTTQNEEYIFNIYEEPRAAIKTISIVMPTTKNETISKKAKPIKRKSHSDRYFRKLQRKPIGQEMN
jgi:hypothetical protein